MYNVLIVDDEDIMLKAMSKIVSTVEGYENIFLARNGKDAVNICKNQIIDIVFMDIIMPVKNGLQASEEILKFRPQTNIYFVSGYHSFELAQFAIKNKIRQYLIKPVSPDTIQSILITHKHMDSANLGNLSRRIYHVVEEKDFIGLYRLIPDIAKELTGNFKSKDFREELYKFATMLFVSMLPESDKSRQLIETEFPVKDNFMQDERLLATWIFKLTEHIFIERSINQYSILQEVFSYIETNIRKSISLNHIVKDCNISQGYLSRIFKKEFNLTIMNYIHIKKINLIKEYICLTNMSVSEISFNIGYNEFGYFCKVFKKYEDTTVTDFRNNNQKM